ncbi:MAG: hypothetical protein CMJ20_00335 [Phycisphaeraceae bacterium]|nr:hypothetical protein [Phycisphaeraceae bacterium]
MPDRRYTQALLMGVNTPWTEQYELHEEMFTKHTEQLLHLGYTHLYVMGTAGEGHAMTDSRYQRVVDVFLQVANKPGLFPQVGVISLSADHMIERVHYAHEKGARMFQISLPSWGRLSGTEKVTYINTVCSSFPDAKFLHYNYASSINSMTADDYCSAVAAVPNLVATKISIKNMALIRALMTRVPQLQHFFMATAFPYACLYGECSLINSLGPVFPNLTRKLFEAGKSGDLTTAFTIQRRMLQIHEGLGRHVKGAKIDGAWDKLNTWLVDPDYPRRLLPPYEMMSDEEATKARDYYEAHCQDIS